VEAVIRRADVLFSDLGIRPDGAGGLDIRAPFGFDELFTGVLRLNSDNPKPDRFHEKCASYRERWPWLTIAEPMMGRTRWTVLF